LVFDENIRSWEHYAQSALTTKQGSIIRSFQLSPDGKRIALLETQSKNFIDGGSSARGRQIQRVPTSRVPLLTELCFQTANKHFKDAAIKLQ